MCFICVPKAEDKGKDAHIVITRVPKWLMILNWIFSNKKELRNDFSDIF